MTGRTLFLLFLISALFGCTDCPAYRESLLAAPLADSDTAWLPSERTATTAEAAITCLDATTVFALDEHEDGLEGDMKGMSGHAQYGDYLAAAFIVSTAEGLAALASAHCLNPGTPLPSVDFTSQTLVILSLHSDTGCGEQLTAELFETAGGEVHLQVSVAWSAGREDCRFDIDRAFIIDDAPEARASVDLSISCAL